MACSIVYRGHAATLRYNRTCTRFPYTTLFRSIELSDISEAFQFFDSQNARGKDLEAHDLLKAYHLREMTQMTESDSFNIDKWQKQNTEFIKNIFLILYRAKR